MGDYILKCPTSGFLDDDVCGKTPEHYEITIYEMGLCSHEPINPDYSSIDKSLCLATFETPTGISANLANNKVDLVLRK